MAGAKLFVDKKLAQGNIVVFSKSYSPDCKLIQRILAEYNLKNLLYVDIESRHAGLYAVRKLFTDSLSDGRQISMYH